MNDLETLFAGEAATLHFSEEGGEIFLCCDVALKNPTYVVENCELNKKKMVLVCIQATEDFLLLMKRACNRRLRELKEKETASNEAES